MLFQPAYFPDKSSMLSTDNNITDYHASSRIAVASQGGNEPTGSFSSHIQHPWIYFVLVYNRVQKSVWHRAF